VAASFSLGVGTPRFAFFSKASFRLRRLICKIRFTFRYQNGEERNGEALLSPFSFFFPEKRSDVFSRRVLALTLRTPANSQVVTGPSIGHG